MSCPFCGREKCEGECLDDPWDNDPEGFDDLNNGSGDEPLGD